MWKCEMCAVRMCWLCWLGKGGAEGRLWVQGRLARWWWAQGLSGTGMAFSSTRDPPDSSLSVRESSNESTHRESTQTPCTAVNRPFHTHRTPCCRSSHSGALVLPRVARAVHGAELAQRRHICFVLLSFWDLCSDRERSACPMTPQDQEPAVTI